MSPIKILADASLPSLRECFPAPFTLTLYQSSEQLSTLLPLHDVLLCRSTLSVNEHLLKNTSIQVVATASSGTDHIDADYLAKQNIQLFDAKGSNARAVADYVVSILAGIKITGKKAGIIGMGEVGGRVAARLNAAGFDLVCYDPLKPQQPTYATTLNELTSCDVICIHANLHDSAPFPSKHLLNAHFLDQLKPNVTLINASRGGIVEEEALLNTQKPIQYCTDVYCNEPAINPYVVDFANICTPHIAGHSIEAKQAAMIQLSQQLHDYYHLPMRATAHSSYHDLVTMPSTHWQETITHIYNPIEETVALKKATDKKSTFLTLRKRHIHRHNFNCYPTDQLNPQTLVLLGH